MEGALGNGGACCNACLRSRRVGVGDGGAAATELVFARVKLKSRLAGRLRRVLGADGDRPLFANVIGVVSIPCEGDGTECLALVRSSRA